MNDESVNDVTRSPTGSHPRHSASLTQSDLADPVENRCSCQVRARSHPRRDSGPCPRRRPPLDGPRFLRGRQPGTLRQPESQLHPLASELGLT
jgi:hypothetical protein